MSVRMSPYIILNGKAKEAVAFYKQALGGEFVVLQTYGEMPADPNYPLPDAMKNLVMHTMLKVGEADVMFSDASGDDNYQVGNNVTIASASDDVENSTRTFNALGEGGQAVLPLQETPWSPAYGQVIDKYGVTWQVNTSAKQV